MLFWRFWMASCVCKDLVLFFKAHSLFFRCSFLVYHKSEDVIWLVLFLVAFFRLSVSFSKPQKRLRSRLLNDEIPYWVKKLFWQINLTEKDNDWLINNWSINIQTGWYVTIWLTKLLIDIGTDWQIIKSRNVTWNLNVNVKLMAHN